MKHPTIDLHGYTIDEALNCFMIRLFNCQSFKEDYLEVITGTGIIKEKVLDYLNEMDYEYLIWANNLGKILVEV